MRDFQTYRHLRQPRSAFLLKTNAIEDIWHALAPWIDEQQKKNSGVNVVPSLALAPAAAPQKNPTISQPYTSTYYHYTASPSTTFTMGWLWSSTPPDSRPSSVQEKSSSFPPQSIPEAAASSTSPSTSTPSKPPTRDELAEQELQSFLSEIAADTAPKASSTKYNRIAKLPPSSTQPKSTPSEDPNEPLSTALLPTTMSCRDAFDAAFYCNSFGGRFNDLYRHGTLRSCSSTWNDFWFCMRTRGYSGPEKEAAIKEHYLRKQDAKYSKGLGKESSENVWRSRDRKMEWGAAFNEPYEEDDVKVSDEEWRRGEREWRSKEAAVGTVSQSQRGS